MFIRQISEVSNPTRYLLKTSENYKIADDLLSISPVSHKHMARRLFARKTLLTAQQVENVL